jgi:hypothetical protein
MVGLEFHPIDLVQYCPGCHDYWVPRQLDELRQAFEILVEMKGECWCGMGIGNPMLKTHQAHCMKAQALEAKFAKYFKPEKPKIC